ncbi:hypothetical protein [Sulfurimonas sp.]|uniref:VirB4 family type IV secretion/conjugal transfer ATPase n=1 Tax=Sulfurimonas sp. TaxID=2022749 RepID=UPI002AB16BDF|nr:hypothetical protein [Sulfurimonas sp.]
MSRNIISTVIKLLTTKIQAQTTWEKMNPFLELDREEDSLILTKNSNFVRVLKLRGKEYSGLDITKIEEYFNIRTELLQMIDDDINVTTHSVREVDVNNNYINNSKKYQDIITKKWNENFKKSYKTYHYIVISNSSLLDLSIMTQLSQNLSTNQKIKKSKVLDNSKKIEAQLSDFEPYILKNEELVSFFSSYINGKSTNQKIPQNKSLTNILPGMTLKFPKDKDYMIYENNINIYSKWVSIQLFDNEKFDELLIEELMSYKAVFTIYQSFQKFPKDKALAVIQKKLNILQNNTDSSNSLAYDEIDDIRQAIERSVIALFNYSFSIQIKNSDLNRLEYDVENIKNIIDGYGYRSFIETENIEPLYWSSLPDYAGYNATKRHLISTNISSMITFTTVAQGDDRCSWGNESLTKFLTSQSTNYDFIFHESTNAQALGNTVVIGGSSSGKTTLITFLCMMALKYPNMKQLYFDKLQGMKVFTEFMDGSYAKFEGDISLNPLQLEDNDINREFLNSFFQIMSGKNSAKDIKDIDDALSQVYEHLPKAQRNLKEFVNAIPGTNEDDSLKANLEIWSTGANKRFFSATKDSLDFSTQISAFNMDSVFHNKKAPTLISYYIFHRLKMIVSETASPSIVVIDEIPDYLSNVDFGKKVVEIILEIRKKDGIAILMGQSLSLFLDTEAGRKIIGSSIANLILFPDTSIKEETKKILNLTSEEFNYIKTQTNKRKPLLKRVNTGGSVQLNVDLSSLGKYLNIFNSSTVAVLKLDRLKKKFPTDWKERYLND